MIELIICNVYCLCAAQQLSYLHRYVHFYFTLQEPKHNIFHAEPSFCHYAEPIQALDHGFDKDDTASDHPMHLKAAGDKRQGEMTGSSCNEIIRRPTNVLYVLLLNSTLVKSTSPRISTPKLCCLVSWILDSPIILVVVLCASYVKECQKARNMYLKVNQCSHTLYNT